MIALPSSGVHSNGFSLVRKVFDVENSDLESDFGVLAKNLGETLLEPTRIYVGPILALLEKVNVKFVCHITGGGFYENIPRSLPENLCAKIFSFDLKIPCIFELIMDKGKIPKKDMFSTFNMGVGMMCAVSRDEVDKAIDVLKANQVDAYVAGELQRGEKGVEII